MHSSRPSSWVNNLTGPLLSLATFLVAYFIDPLNFGELKPTAAMPAFLLSVVVLLINHNASTAREIRKASLFTDQIEEAVRNYLHVTSLGSPEQALRYIVARIPALREAKNTSFNIEDEEERANEKFYDTAVYKGLSDKIAAHCSRGLLWKDVGDHLAIERLRGIERLVSQQAPTSRESYKYRLIGHAEPQMNFILLEFADGSTEVLFNWDFRGLGQDPKVLVSRDPQIVEMFAIQFSYLWRAASRDHDSTATRSTSTK